MNPSGHQAERRRPRLLFLQPSLQPPGGGNGVCAWMLQALRDDYDLDLLTWRRVDFAAVNRYYGTDLDPTQVRPLPPLVAPRLLDLLPTPAALLKSSLLLRRARSIAGRYEGLVTANNEADFGRPGIQYVHYPWSYRPRPAVDMRWYHATPLLRAYYGLVERVSPFDLEGVRRNLTLVNSDWTAALVRELYPGIRTRTLHPPVAGPFPEVPWEEREDGVVVVGRISAEKRPELAIEIVHRVRERGRALRLHLVGSRDDRATYRNVVTLARRHRDWLRVHEDLPRPELCALMARQRWGLHAMAEEHYGMAVAEMVVAGLVPFVPDGGGQREILEGLPELCWKSGDEAVDRINGIVADPERTQQIRRTLAARREGLGTERFLRQVRAEVAGFLAGRSPGGRPAHPIQSRS